MKSAIVKQLIQDANLYNLNIKNEGRYWIIEVCKAVYRTREAPVILQTDKGEDRKFKTLDAAYNVCMGLGRKDVAIEG